MIYALFLSGYYQNYYKKYPGKPPTDTLAMTIGKPILGTLKIGLACLLHVHQANAAEFDRCLLKNLGAQSTAKIVINACRQQFINKKYSRDASETEISNMRGTYKDMPDQQWDQVWIHNKNESVSIYSIIVSVMENGQYNDYELLRVPMSPFESGTYGLEGRRTDTPVKWYIRKALICD